jgi:predicted ester cyclase
MEIHDMFAAGDRVATRKTIHGTHEGEFMGIPPTGRAVAVDVIDIVRYEDGKLAEHWNVVDQLGLMRQLGVVE